jgi:hypothetical protein
MRAIAENRIAHVAEMRHLHAVQQQAVLELTRVAQHAVLAHDDIAANECPRPDFGARANPHRPMIVA